jgi:hypothetical protein
MEGKIPFPLEELYLLKQPVRWLVTVCTVPTPISAFAQVKPGRAVETWRYLTILLLCRDQLSYHPPRSLAGFRQKISMVRKRASAVMVTGCYDWFHSVTSLLRRALPWATCTWCGAPTSTPERKATLFGRASAIRVQSVRFVKADAHLQRARLDGCRAGGRKIRPHIYAVNEDGDKPEKRAFCEQHGLGM